MEKSQYKDIYLNLHNTVQESLSQDLDKERITDIVQQVVGAFNEDPYNELLLYFYTQPSDQYLVTHITNNVILAVGFGKSLSLSADVLLDVGLCAFGHDFGMAEYLPVFQKMGELTEEESRLIKNHTRKSAEKFQSIFSDKVILGILDVHEQVDGGGYPSGKMAVEISNLAKIISVCDVFEALTHVRNFRSEVNPYEAIKYIIKKKDITFDGSVVKRFVDFLSIYPIGTLVLLNTNEIGVVVGSNYASPTRSLTKILLDSHRELDQTGKVYDLLENKMVYVVEALGTEQIKEISDVMEIWGGIKV